MEKEIKIEKINGLFYPFSEVVRISLAKFENDYSGYFAKFYDIIQPDTPDLDFYSKLIDSCGGEALELGCGNGRLLIPLIQKGHKLTGLDNSLDMLDILTERCSKLPASISARVTLIHADMTDFKLNKLFPLIFIPLNTFLGLSKESQRLEMLRCVKQHLEKNGSFVIDISISNPLAESSAPIFDLFESKKSDMKNISISQEFPGSTNETKFINFFNIFYKGEEQIAITVSMTEEWCANYYSLFNLLKDSGFKITTAYSNYDLSPFNEGDSNLIVIANLC